MSKTYEENIKNIWKARVSRSWDKSHNRRI